MMKRLTADNPEDNYDKIMNFAFDIDSTTYLRNDGAREFVSLNEWAVLACLGCHCGDRIGELHGDGIPNAECGACAPACEECPEHLIYTLAIQAASLRERLKQYEDIGLDPAGVRRLAVPQPNAPLTLEELREMDGSPVWNDTMKKWAIVDLFWEYGPRTVDARGQWSDLDDCYYRRKPETAPP